MQGYDQSNLLKGVTLKPRENGFSSSFTFECQKSPEKFMSSMQFDTHPLFIPLWRGSPANLTGARLLRTEVTFKGLTIFHVRVE